MIVVCRGGLLMIDSPVLYFSANVLNTGNDELSTGRSFFSRCFIVPHCRRYGAEDIESIQSGLYHGELKKIPPSVRAAGRNTRTKVITSLLEGGADVNARAENDVTPLHMAAIENTNPEVIRVLLGAGADVNAKTGESVTPLHLAAMDNTNPEVVEVLLESGADAKIRDAGGCSPLDMAEENKNLKGTDAYRSLEKASDFEVSERWSFPYGHSGAAHKN